MRPDRPAPTTARTPQRRPALTKALALAVWTLGLPALALAVTLGGLPAATAPVAAAPASLPVQQPALPEQGPALGPAQESGGPASAQKANPVAAPAVAPLLIAPLPIEVKVVASNGPPNGTFGVSVAIDGDIAVIGAYQNQGNVNDPPGIAYVFARDGAGWTQIQQLQPNDPANANYFGESVDIDGNTIVVGAPGVGGFIGAAYVFVLSGGVWVQQQKLTASDAGVGDGFGVAVAVSADTVLVGSPNHSHMGNPASGSAYAYTRTAGVWSQQTELRDAARLAGDSFGAAVDLGATGNIAVIGANQASVSGGTSGTAYVYPRVSGTWQSPAVLAGADTGGGDIFGTSVGVDSAGQTVIVGAPSHVHAGTSSGSAYVFRATGANTWAQSAELLPGDAGSNQRFGWAVSMNHAGDGAVVGAYNAGSSPNEGRAYLFEKIGTAWNQTQEFEASDTSSGSYYGAAVAIAQSTVLVGAEDGCSTSPVNGCTRNGTAYFYQRSPTDLRISKTDTPDPAAAGTDIFYTLLVENVSTTVATGVVVTDTLPTLVTYVSDTAGCDTSGLPTLSCALPDIAPGASRSFQVRVHLPNNLGTATMVVNRAAVLSAEPDAEPADNFVAEGTFLDTQHDLALVKTASPSPVRAGEALIYTLTVTNHGPVAASGVVVTDTLPAGVVFVSTSLPCNTGGLPVVVCNLADIAPGASRSVDIKVNVPANAADASPFGTIVLSNTATTRSSLPEVNLADNTDTLGTFVMAMADVSIQKTDSPDPVFAGQEVIYTLKAANAGPNRASDVTVVDILPAGVTLLANSGGCSLAGLTLTCPPFDLAPGQQQDIQLKVYVPADFVANTLTGTGIITNTATVSSDALDPNPQNNLDREVTFVQESADLRIIKFSKPDDVVAANELFTYTIFVENLGPSAARNVSIRDEIVATGTFDVVATVLDPVLNDNGPFPVTTVGGAQALEFDLNEPLLPQNVNGVGRWVVQVVVRSTSSVSQDVNNVVSVFGRQQARDTGDPILPTPDPNLANNVAQDFIHVAASANLQIAKVAGSSSVIAGNQLQYFIQITNTGPSAALNATIVDILPPNVRVISVIGTGLAGAQSHCVTGTPGSPANPTKCTFDRLNNGDGAFVTVTVQVDRSTPINLLTGMGQLNNDAYTYSDALDPDLHDNLYTAAVAVTAQAQLAFTKVATPNPVAAGGRVNYHITLTNNGPSTAHNLTLQDNFTAGGQFVQLLTANFNGAVGRCYQENAGTPSVLCDLSDLLPGRSIALDLVLAVDPAAPPGTLLTNVLSAAADGTVTSSGDTSESVTVAASADLAITKSVSNAVPVAADIVQYTVHVQNLGPSDAPGVVVVDVLPVGVTYLVDTDACVQAPVGTLTCALGTIAAGTGKSFDITVRINANATPGSTLTNTASVSSGATDPNLANNSASARFVVGTQADLRVLKFGKPDDSVQAGERLTYTVIVDNLGPSFAHTVQVRDELVSSGRFSVLSVNPDLVGNRPTASCAPAAPINNINQRQTLTCSLNAVLEPIGPGTGVGRWMIEVVVLANETSSLNNVATVTAADPDPNPGNNVAQVEHQITDVADLRVVKAGSPDPVLAGQTLTYSMTVTNGGPSVAQNVVVYDRLPAGIVVTSATVTGGGSCTTGTPGSPADRLTCGLGSLASGGSKRVTIVATVRPEVPDGTTLENDVFVVSDIYDPNTANNFAFDLTTVLARANLGITKTDSPDPVTAGTGLAYVLTVTNAGPSVAQLVRVQDNLPAGVTFVSAVVLGGLGGEVCSYSPALQRVACLLGDLPPGPSGTRQVRIDVAVDAGYPVPGVLNNAASVASMTIDPVPGNNTANATTTVNAAAELAILKVVSDPTPVAGTQFDYLLTVHNSGPSDAQNVQIVDVLPVGVTYLLDDDGCVQAPPGTLTCALGTIAADGTRSVKITLRLNADAPPGATLTNTATVSSTTPDPILLNNVATARIVVDTQADLRVLKFGKPDVRVRAGEILSYTVIVDNLGPSFAHNVQLRDELVSSGRFSILAIDADVVGNRPTASCAPAAPILNINQRQILTCSLGAVLEPFGPGVGVGRWVIEVTVEANQTSSLNNVASVTASDPDPNSSNNVAQVEHEITDVSDLRVAKVGSPKPVLAGQTLSYSMTVTNGGPSIAENVVVYDRLPAGIVVSSATVAGGGNCVTGTPGSPADRLTCALGSLANGGSKTVTVVATVRPDVPDGTVLENDVFVLSDIYDPENANNYAFDLTTVRAQADLGITKTDSPDPVTAGKGLAYVLSITNAGPSMARNVQVQDNLPLGLSFVSAAVVGGVGSEVCSHSLTLHLVTCLLGDLPPGAAGSRQVRIDLVVDPSYPAPGVLNNLASVASTTTDLNPANNVATATTTVNASADLAITKTVSDDTPVAGSQFDYFISVHNNGPSDAQNVQVVDVLPAGVTFLVDDDACVEAPVGTLTCSLGTIPAGGTRNIKLTVRLNADAPPGATLTNTATVSSTTPDPNLANNTATSRIVVDTQADLRVLKFGKPDTRVRAGQRLTYTIIVDNLGPSFAHGVQVRDELVASKRFSVLAIDADVVGNRPSATCAPAAPINNINQRQTITCSLNANLEPFGPGIGVGRWVVEIVVQANDTQSLNDVATVTGNDPDPDPGNNVARVEHEITDVADLRVSKTGAPNPVIAGQLLTYSIAVTNGGPSVAENVVLYDRLPPGIVVQSATVPGGSCATGSAGDPADRLTCGLGNIANGGTRTVTIVARVNADVPAGTTLENDVFVVSDIYDPNNANNFAADLTNVTTSADLGIQKFGNPNPIAAGTILSYDLTYVNNGPSVAREVIVTDSLPPNIDPLSVFVVDGSNVFDSATCHIRTGDPALVGSVICELGDLAPGARGRIVITAFVRPSAPAGVVTNTATISSTTPDPGPTPNTATFNTNIVQSADLAVTKSASDPTPVAGTEFQYTVNVVNNGPSNATAVQVVDVLPAGVTYLVDDDTCSQGPPGTLTCQLGNLPVGASSSFRITVRLNADAPPGATLTNTATVSSATPDPNLANNSATARIYVTSVADLRVLKFGKRDARVRAGDILTYTIVVDNLGPSFAHTVRLKDLLRSSGTFDVVNLDSDRDLSCQSDPNPPSGSGTPADPYIPGNVNSLDIDCTLDDPLSLLDAPGQFPNPGRWTITLRVRATQTQSINNVASVKSADVDPDFTNNQARVEHEITPVADLSVSKIGTPDPVIAGQQITYQITVNNAGPSVAENTVLYDRLPPGIVVTSATVAGGGDCITGTAGNVVDRLTCGLGSLVAGGQKVVTVVATVKPDVPAGTRLENDVTVLSDIFDPTTSNNFAFDLATVDTSADLSVQKFGDPNPVLAGDITSYDIAYANAGPSVARDVVLTDVLPPNIDPVSVFVVDGSPIFDSATCHIRSGDPTLLASVTCELGDLVPGAAGRIVITVRVRPNAPAGVVTNNVSIDSTTPDPDPSNNTATFDTTIAPSADLAITKSALDTTPVAGEQLTYRITVVNQGPSDASAVQVVDTLPAGLTYRIDTDACVQGPVGTLTCQLGNLLVGQSKTFDITVLVNENVPPATVLTNTAVVSSPTPDPDLANNTSRPRVFIRTVADLRITKFGKPDKQVRAGQNLTYTIVVDNLGPSWAHEVVMTDTLTSSKRFTIVSIDPDVLGNRPSAVCTPPAPTPNLNQRHVITCNLNQDLEVFAPGNGVGRWVIEIVVTAPQTSSIDNLAAVSSIDRDPDPWNNLALVEHEITNVADLSVTKTAIGQVTTPGCPPGTSNVANQVTAGRQLTYTIVVKNAGPSVAENVVLYDRLPAGLVTRSALVTGGTGSCSTGSPGNPADKLTCGLGSIAPTGQKTITIVADVSPSLANGTVLENDVFVLSDIFDPFNDNNFAHNLTTVNTQADLSVSKSDSPDPVVAGRTLQYTINVTNNGPSDAQNVIAVDTLPAQVTYQSASGAVCRQDPILTAKLTCQLGNIPAGKTVTFYLVVLVNPNAVPSGGSTTNISNTVVVSSDTTDPCATNNTATQTTTVNRVDDVFITKTGTPDPVLAGEEVAYTIVFGNNGPSTSTNVSVLDTLPKGVTWNRCEPIDPNDAVSCQVLSGDGNLTAQVVRLNQIQKANTVVWSFVTGNATNDLDPGETYSFRLIGKVASGYVLDGRGDVLAGQACQAYLATTGWFHFAADRATISSLTDAAVAGNNFDDVCTRVNAAADLAITQTVQGGPPPPPPPFLLAAQRPPAEAPPPSAHRPPPPAPPPTAGGGGPEGLVGTQVTPFLTNESPLPQPLGEGPGVGANGPGVGANGPTSPAPPVDLELTQVTGCSVVARGGLITYTLTVTNLGPSDAAQVFVVDQLPAQGVVLDPSSVAVTVSRGQVQTVRDDGFIEVIVGNDPNNLGVNQLGRLNAGSVPVVITIRVRVADNAVCGSTLVNIARVETRRNDVIWPILPGARFARTPTPDPNPANNTSISSITVACPSIRVRKTVSFNGQCPGRPGTVVNQTGQPVTFCFEIINTGDTYLDNVHIVDVLTTRTGGRQVIFDQVIKDGQGGNVPLAPGEIVRRQVTIPQLLLHWDCGKVTDTVTVTADPTNSGRTRLTCLPVVSGSDTVLIEVPCAGVDFRLQLPVINNPGCETWIQVQNVGDQVAKPMLVAWGAPSACPPQAAGPLKVECGGLLRPGSAWSFAGSQIPNGSRSAMVYSLNATDKVKDERGNDIDFSKLACSVIFDNIVGSYDEWVLFDEAYRLRGTYTGPIGPAGQRQTLDFGAHLSEPLAVTVNRKCPDAGDPNVMSNAAYTGISSDQEGAQDPTSGGYTSYAPLILAQRAGLNSLLYIHNSGTDCTSLEIWFKAQDNCLRAILGDVLTLSPGETIVFDPNTVVGPDWIGSAWIRSTQPLGIVVDTMGANHFTAYNGVPGDVSDLIFSYGDQVVFAPLVYNQQQGWDTAIQVQNHSATTPAKVKVYFLDNGGGIVETIVDWICPRGSQSFFLPVIGGLPGNWVGSARIESQAWWAPGTSENDPPLVSAVVMLEKWSDPARTTRREAVAYNAQGECILYDWQIGQGQGGLQSGSAVFAIPLLQKEYNGVTTELAITNLVPKPGFTDFAIFIYDQNGLIDFVCQKLTEKQVEYINLATWGYVNPRFNGSAIISATFWEHDVFDPVGGFQRNVVGLGGVGVERVGGVNGGPDVPGDESKAFESFPVYDNFRPERMPDCGP